MLKKIETLIRRQVYKSYFFILFPILYHKIKYFDLYKEYRLIKKNLYNSIVYNRAVQRKRLFELVDFAIANVPYYKRIAKERNITISRKNIFEEIKKFPILTKELIRKNFNNLHPDLSKVSYIIQTSGGTTGEPVKLIQDMNYVIKNIAFHIVSNEIGGHNLGEKLNMLWGDEKEIIKQTKGRLKQIINKFITNIHFQNAFRMSDDIMKRYINELYIVKPKVIFAYTQSIYELAKYINRENLKPPPISSIIATAGVVTDEIKEYIQNTFKCLVYNRYGSREVSVVATSCEESDKLHINVYQQYIEIVDSKGNCLKEHERGDIIVTNLINYGMPLIRYKIGDRGAMDSSKCSCGRGLVRLENVYGRTVDIFRNKNGELIDGEYFTHLFYFRKNIQQFQVIQEKIDKIKINLVTLNKQQLDTEVEEEFTDKIRKAMGEECNVNFNYVSKIEPSPSGKIRYTISYL